MRVVSLVPSATEICYLLGAENVLVGVSHECDYPAEARNHRVITQAVGTMRKSHANTNEVENLVCSATGLSVFLVDIDQLILAKPDIIFAQKICASCSVPTEQVHAFVRKVLGYDVQIEYFCPEKLEDIFDDIQRIGGLLHREEAAQRQVRNLRARVAKVREQSAKRADHPSVATLAWLDPLMIAGQWSPELIQFAGGNPVIVSDAGPTKRVDLNELLKADPEYLFVTLCSYDLEMSTAEMLQFLAQPAMHALRAVQNQQCFVFDGTKLFTRAGPRLIDTLEYASHLLTHPGIINLQLPGIHHIQCVSLVA